MLFKLTQAFLKVMRSVVNLHLIVSYLYGMYLYIRIRRAFRLFWTGVVLCTTGNASKQEKQNPVLVYKTVRCALRIYIDIFIRVSIT